MFGAYINACGHHHVIWEVAEYATIAIVLFILSRTLQKLWRAHQPYFVAGALLVAGLLTSVFFLPHGFVAGFLLAIAAFQFLTDRLTCPTECHAK